MKEMIIIICAFLPFVLLTGGVLFNLNKIQKPIIGALLLFGMLFLYMVGFTVPSLIL